jgi:hypothetical protein
MFLRLAARNPGVNLLPTPDIDLLWRAHLSHPSAYDMDCEALLGPGCVLEYSGAALGSNGRCMETTSRLWAEEYDEQYVPPMARWPSGGPCSASSVLAEAGGSSEADARDDRDLHLFQHHMFRRWSGIHARHSFNTRHAKRMRNPTLGTEHGVPFHLIQQRQQQQRSGGSNSLLFLPKDQQGEGDPSSEGLTESLSRHDHVPAHLLGATQSSWEPLKRRHMRFDTQPFCVTLGEQEREPGDGGGHRHSAGWGASVFGAVA